MKYVIMLAALGVAVATPGLAQKQELPKGEVRVVRIIDGDTIKVSDMKASIRLMGFDTPEIHRNPRSGYKCEAERDMGLKAKTALEELLLNPDAKVVVKRSDLFDSYGRRVAKVLVDGKDVKDIMIGKGLAQEWDGTPPKPAWC